MDMRTKLVFSLVAVSLASMLAMGAITYTTARSMLRENTLSHLEGLAETKREALEDLFEGWRDRIGLIASRPRLQQDLRAHTRSPSTGTRADLLEVLDDVLRSVRTVEALVLLDAQGDEVVALTRTPADPPVLGMGGPAREASGGDAPDITYLGVEVAPDGGLRVGFTADVMDDGERVGGLEVVLGGGEVLDLAANVAGLGETGETMILLADFGGQPYIARGRDQSESPVPRDEMDDPSDPLVQIAAGREGRHADGVVDYRGEQVWMAARHLEEAGWGVIVKFDEDEANAPMLEFRATAITLAISISAFAILLATLLGLRFARPIHELADVTTRIRDGDLDARAPVVTEDEVGVLARTFNQMADELERRMSLLREFHKFFEVSRDMLCIADTDGYFKRTNPAFGKILGWSDEELTTRPFLDFVHPDDIEATLLEIEKLSQGIPTISFENRYLCADGSYKHLRWTSHPDGSTLYAVARDITELKRSQEMFGLALESSSTAMLMIDPEGTIELVNPAAEELFQYTAAELTGQAVELLVPDALREGHGRQRERYMREPRPRPMGLGHEFPGRRKDGSEVPVEIGLSPVRTDKGVHVLVSVVDLSALKAAEREIDALTRRLEQARDELRAS